VIKLTPEILAEARDRAESATMPPRQREVLTALVKTADSHAALLSCVRMMPCYLHHAPEKVYLCCACTLRKLFGIPSTKEERPAEVPLPALLTNALASLDESLQKTFMMACLGLGPEDTQNDISPTPLG